MANSYWIAADVFTDVVFLLDILVQLRTGYLEQGLMVFDSKKLAAHYIKCAEFTFDVLALIPLDLIQFAVGINPILRFPRFLKVSNKSCWFLVVFKGMGLRCIPLLIWRFKSSKYYLLWKIYKNPLLEIVLSTGLPLRNDGKNRSFIEVLSSLSSFQRSIIIVFFIVIYITITTEKCPVSEK